MIDPDRIEKLRRQLDSIAHELQASADDIPAGATSSVLNRAVVNIERASYDLEKLRDVEAA